MQIKRKEANVESKLRQGRRNIENLQMVNRNNKMITKVLCALKRILALRE